MKRTLFIVLAIVLIALAWQIYQMYFLKSTLSQKAGKLEAKILNLQQENSDLQTDLEYLKNPENLEKELRGRFNYKKPGEKMIIVVPSQSATSSKNQ